MEEGGGEEVKGDDARWKEREPVRPLDNYDSGFQTSEFAVLKVVPA